MEYDEQLRTILVYLRENVGGLVLLVLACFIIYVVDYVNQINIMLYSTPSSVPGLTNVRSVTSALSNSYKKSKKR